MKLISKVLSVGLLFAAPFVASATPISGSLSLVSFSGTYVGPNCTPSCAQAATGLDFGAAFTGTGNGYGTNGTALIGNAMGSFSGLTGLANIADISLNGTVANPFSSNPFLSFTGSNIIVNFSNATVTRSSTGASVTVKGNAMFEDGNAADSTVGLFEIATSTQTSGMTQTVNFTFTGNASGIGTPASVTPEPSSLALLGTGIVSLGGMVRRRIKRA